MSRATSVVIYDNPGGQTEPGDDPSSDEQARARKPTRASALSVFSLVNNCFVGDAFSSIGRDRVGTRFFLIDNGFYCLTKSQMTWRGTSYLVYTKKDQPFGLPRDR